MRRVMLPIIIVFGLVLLGIIALAQGVDRSNEPNACFDGGSMAGKCETMQAWICGWYVYRYEQGVFGADKVLAECLPLIGITGMVTATPVPPLYTETPTNTATSVPLVPTETPTNTVTPTDVPPTATPTNTATTEPTATPTFTSTPEPTATPTYTSTPA